MDDTDVLHLNLFEIARKYRKMLRSKNPISIDEAEKDRKQTSEIYQYLKQMKELLLDAEIYADYILMHELREELNLENLLKTKGRIDSFSDFVRKKATPLISVIGEKKFPSTIFDLKEANEKVIKPRLDEQFGFWDIRRDQLLETEMITYGDLMNLEEQVKRKLIGKKLEKEELEKLLTPIELEVLSKLTSEKKILAILNGDKIFFTEVSQEERGFASSLLLSSRAEGDDIT